MIKIFIIALSLAITTPPSAYAQCKKAVSLLNEGDTADCTGYLFSPDKEKEVRGKVKELELTKEEIQIKDKKIKLYKDDVKTLEEILTSKDKQTELWRNRAVESTEKLVEAEESRGTRDILFILLGIGLTVGAGYAVGAAGN